MEMRENKKDKQQLTSGSRKNEKGKLEIKMILNPLQRVLPNGKITREQGIYLTPYGRIVGAKMLDRDNTSLSRVYGYFRGFVGIEAGPFGEKIPIYWIEPIEKEFMGLLAIYLTTAHNFRGRFDFVKLDASPS